MDNIINGKGFPGCKHTNESALQAIFSSITSLILIIHVLIMVSILVLQFYFKFKSKITKLKTIISYQFETI